MKIYSLIVTILLILAVNPKERDHEDKVYIALVEQTGMHDTRPIIAEAKKFIIKQNVHYKNYYFFSIGYMKVNDLEIKVTVGAFNYVFLYNQTLINKLKTL
jgi:hypothetical protein